MPILVKIFESMLQNKCIQDSDMLTVLAIHASQIMYLLLLSIISLTLETLAWPVTVAGWPGFADFLTDSAVPVRNSFLHLQTVW